MLKDMKDKKFKTVGSVALVMAAVTTLCANYARDTHYDEGSQGYGYDIHEDEAVAYIYPRGDTDGMIKMDAKGNVSYEHPEYDEEEENVDEDEDDEWEEPIRTDGTITDKDGKKHAFLFWKGETHEGWDFTKGFCVKGRDTQGFLEASLTKLSLTKKEQDDFIAYWLPKLKANRYNVIFFQSYGYDMTNLKTKVLPDTFITVSMAYYPSDGYVYIKPQDLLSRRRKGATAVEWSGGMIKDPDI